MCILSITNPTTTSLQIQVSGKIFLGEIVSCDDEFVEGGPGAPGGPDGPGAPGGPGGP